MATPDMRPFGHIWALGICWGLIYWYLLLSLFYWFRTSSITIAKVVFGLDLFLISLCWPKDYQSIWKCFSKQAVSTMCLFISGINCNFAVITELINIHVDTSFYVEKNVNDKGLFRYDCVVFCSCVYVCEYVCVCVCVCVCCVVYYDERVRERE